MDIFYTLHRVNGYRKVYKNWFNVIIKVKNGENQIPVILRGKKEEVICTLSCVITLVDLVQKLNYELTRFNIKDNKLFYDNNLIIQDNYLSVLLSASGFVKNSQEWYSPKYNVRFIEPINFSLSETFVLEQYNTEIQGDVIDIGANIGDSAIYFALKGASHVYAFEPLPSIYRIALQNVKINNLDDRITLINAGVASNEGKVKVPSSIGIEKSREFSIKDQGDVEVPLISFRDVLKMAKDPYLLKMDCEGCEADILLNVDSLPFEKIFVESHPPKSKVPHKKLLSKLGELKYKCKERGKGGKEAKIFYCEKIN
ncbi:FkbM family methyltransferase [Saccharolobus solfataricus]